MKAQQARELGAHLSDLVASGELDQAQALLSPVLKERIPFAKLRMVGSPIGAVPQTHTDAFLERIAAGKTEGGWVIIASVLGIQLGSDLPGTLSRTRAHTIAGDIWYCCDILAEGVPGSALVSMFDQTLQLLEPWRNDENHWVRRSVGISTHFWAKRSKGEQTPQAGAMLQFLDMVFEERKMEAVKGIGWGLKTLGRMTTRGNPPWR